MYPKFSVLLVEDNPDIRQLLTVALEMAGYLVFPASDGLEGLKLIKAQHIDLVIADATMPIMDGFKLTQRLRSNPQTRFIPVIILGVRETPEEERQSVSVGAVSYIRNAAKDLELLLARARLFLDLRSYIGALEDELSKVKQGSANDIAAIHSLENAEFSREDIDALNLIKQKTEAGIYDVFLCHNSEDKNAVKNMGKKLQKLGIRPWLDEWALRPGLPWQDILEQEIRRIKSAAVFVGGNGIGPWQRKELNAFLREFVERGCPVIPVLLSNAPQKPELPIFLKGMTWVDFRKQDPDPISQLTWGITGEQHLA